MPHYPFNYYTLHAACSPAERVPHIPGVEVLDIDILVRSSFALAPEQQTLFGGQLFHRDVLDGKPKDDCPDHAEGQFRCTVADF